jgi:hypothetical protein
LCRVNGGGRPVIVVCRSLRKVGDGDSAVLTNWPGRISCEPNTASAGENSLSSLNEALMPSITQGRWSCQSEGAALERKASFSRLWNRSTNPFDCGWYDVVGECWMLSRLHRPAHRADVSWAPLSDVMVAETPNRNTQPAKRTLAQSAAVMDESGMNFGNLEVRSIIVKR